MEGPLSKWTNLVNGWQYRWFVLNSKSGILSYFTSRDKMKKGSRRGCINLRKAMIGIDDEDDSGFSITSESKQYHFQARDAQDREKWIRALEFSIYKLNSMVNEPVKDETTSSASTLPHKNLETNNDSVLQPNVFITPTDQESAAIWGMPSTYSDKNFDFFDMKIVEADAYLQILINQLKKLEFKMEKMIEDDEIHKKYSEIKVSTHALIDSVKHSIVVLQITRNALFPNSSGIYRSNLPALVFPAGTSFSTPEITRENGFYRRSEERIQHLTNRHDHHHPFNSSTSPSLELSATPLPPSPFYPTNKTTALVPADYSAPSSFSEDPTESWSEGEDSPPDAFFDAESEEISHKTTTTATILNKQITKNDNSSSEKDGTNSLFQEDMEEENEEDISQYGGMIKHLVSQVRIGMDLTKVTLPTFILERRSLLEMFADFFAHADLFSNITDGKSTKERMTLMVKYYLSSFHAGRSSAVAKKPFNPILGEVFRCRWEAPTSSSLNSQQVVIPRESKSSSDFTELLYVSEQVSHHPPVSAFYAENERKKTYLNGNIWTKSKFLGLSIGVHMIGQACINLLEHDEEYVCTFPNAYARSIFSVPWVELGGKVSITCSKTGHFADIEFLTKPFYGGQKNQIICQIYSPFEKNAYLTISGAWNGIMIAKTSNGDSYEFFNTEKEVIIPKIVKPIHEQEIFESRKVWFEVAINLKDKNLEKATDVKCSIEESERQKVRERSEARIKWECRYFDEINGNWIFKKRRLETT